MVRLIAALLFIATPTWAQALYQTQGTAGHVCPNDPGFGSTHELTPISIKGSAGTQILEKVHRCAKSKLVATEIGQPKMGSGFLPYIWLVITLVSLLVSWSGIKGYRLFSMARMIIVAGVSGAGIALSFASWLAFRGHPHLSLSLCLIAAGIAWEFYRHAEDESIRIVVEEVLDRQKFWPGKFE